MAEKEKEKDEKDKEEGGAEAAAPAKGKGKLLIIVGGLIALLVAIGVPLYLFVLKPAPVEEKTDELEADAAHEHHLVPEGHGEEEELLEGEVPLGAFFPLDTFVVNLTGGRYLRMQAQLEFAEREIPQRFYSRTVIVRDAIINLISARTADDVQSAEQKIALKKDIKDIVNEILKKEEVKQVYFTQFVVQ